MIDGQSDDPGSQKDEPGKDGKDGTGKNGGKSGLETPDENSLSLSRSGREDRGDDKDENSSSAEQAKKPKTEGVPSNTYIEKSAFVQMPVDKNGQPRQLPHPVKLREGNIIEKLKELKAQAGVKEEDHDLRTKLNDILVTVVNNNRLSYTEYYTSVQELGQQMRDEKELLRAEFKRRLEEIARRHEQDKQNLAEEHKKALAEENRKMNELKERMKVTNQRMGVIEKKWECDWHILKGFSEKGVEVVPNIFWDLMEKNEKSKKDIPEVEDYFKELLASPEFTLLKRGAPLSGEEWTKCFDETGKITDPDAIKLRISEGGIDSSIRGQVWKYLLRFYPWDSTEVQRKEIDIAKELKYIELDTWSTQCQANIDNWKEYSIRLDQIDKDVARTDRDEREEFKDDNSPYLAQIKEILRNHLWLNWNIGYLQGMNDLLVPITILMSTKHISFWCFSELIVNMQRLFDKHHAMVQELMKKALIYLEKIDPFFYAYLRRVNGTNFFFCFRWFLLYFKREFIYYDIYTIWEAIWTTSFPEKDYVAMIAVSIILKHRDYILENKLVHDDILRYMNSISGKLSAEEVLEFTNSLYTKFIVQNFTYPQKKTSIFGSNDQRILFI